MWIFSTALAGGYFFSTPGVQAAGRGGAWVAGAKTQFAQFYNPAGLIHVEDVQLNVGVSLVGQPMVFEPLQSDNTLGKPIINEGTAYLVPQMGVAARVTKDLSVALGVTTPFASDLIFDDRSLARYMIKDGVAILVQTGPSAAFRVSKHLVLGGGITWEFLDAGQQLDLTLTSQLDPAGDIAVDVRSKDPFTLSYNLGLLFEPSPDFVIGVSWDPAVDFVTRGPVNIDFTDNVFEPLLGQSAYRDDDISISVTMPSTFRLGVQGRPTKNLEIEWSVEHQTWSVQHEQRISEVYIEIDASFLPEEDRIINDDIILPTGLKDTFAQRIGAEWSPNPWLSLRTGGYHETGSKPSSQNSVALFDPSKIQWGGGFSARFLHKRLFVDTMATRLWFPTLNIVDSQIRQIDAGVLPNASPKTVGNGRLSGSGWTAGAQLRVALTKGAIFAPRD